MRILLLTIFLVPLLAVILYRILIYTHAFFKILFSLKIVYPLQNEPYFYNFSLSILVLNIWETGFIMPQMQ